MLLGKRALMASAGLISLLTLSGCLISQEAKIADKDYTSTKKEIGVFSDNLHFAKKPEQKSLAVHIKDRPWLGLKPKAVPKGTLLPEQFRTANGISIPFEEPLGLSELANRIYAATRIPVTIKGQATNNSLSAFTPVSNISTTDTNNIVFQGPLDALLNQWTSLYGYDWEYNDNEISIIRYGASAFTINALAGVDQFSTNQASSAEIEGSNSLASQSLSTSYSFDLFKELEEQATALVNEDTVISVSPTNGTLTVKGVPRDIKVISNFLNHMNNKILRTVTLSVRILDIQRTRSADYDLSLDILLEDVLGKQSLQFVTGSTSNLIGTIRPLPTGTTTNTINGTIQALNSIGTISRNLEGTVAALNGQPIPLENITTRSYLRSTSTDSVDGAVAQSFEIGEVSSGFFISFLPRIVGDDQVRVRMNLGLQDLLELREFTSDGTTLQFPEQSSNAIKIERLIRSGDTLIISGISDNKTNGSRSGLGDADNWFFGGNQDADLIRKEQIILLSAEIEPPHGITEYKADLL